MPFGIDPLVLVIGGIALCILGALVWTGLKAWFTSLGSWTLIMFIRDERTGAIERFTSDRISVDDCRTGVQYVLSTDVGRRLQAAVAKAPDGQEFTIYPEPN